MSISDEEVARLKAEMKVRETYNFYFAPRVTPDSTVLAIIERMETAEKSLADAVARAERAEAVVGRLPKTADGVPVTPGMPLYDHITEYIVRMLACDETGVYPIDLLYTSRNAWRDAHTDAPLAAKGVQG